LEAVWRLGQIQQHAETGRKALQFQAKENISPYSLLRPAILSLLGCLWFCLIPGWFFFFLFFFFVFGVSEMNGSAICHASLLYYEGL
jgi:hypothetical protein